MIYLFRWKNNSKRRDMFGRPIRMIARGRANSALVEFTDNNQREIVSRNALKKRGQLGLCLLPTKAQDAIGGAA